MKQLIGLFRIAVCLFVGVYLEIEFLDTRNIETWVSDLIHGGHTQELRDSMSVKLSMLVIQGVIAFYILQTVVYIFVGHAMEGKNTGLFRFIGLVISGLQECARDPYFWTSDSGSGDFNRLDDLMKYRDNKMAFMSNEQAADYMRGTGHVDFMMANRDLKQSRNVLGYLNNKVALMSNEQAIDYLKGKK